MSKKNNILVVLGFAAHSLSGCGTEESYKCKASIGQQSEGSSCLKHVFDPPDLAILPREPIMKIELPIEIVQTKCNESFSIGHTANSITIRVDESMVRASLVSKLTQDNKTIYFCPIDSSTRKFPQVSCEITIRAALDSYSDEKIVEFLNQRQGARIGAYVDVTQVQEDKPPWKSSLLYGSRESNSAIKGNKASVTSTDLMKINDVKDFVWTFTENITCEGDNASGQFVSKPYIYLSSLRLE